jgi:hypothetical protein
MRPSGSLSSLWKEFAMAVKDITTRLQRHNLASDGAAKVDVLAEGTRQHSSMTVPVLR